MMIFFHLILMISGLLFRALELKKLMEEDKAAPGVWMDTVTSPPVFAHGIGSI